MTTYNDIPTTPTFWPRVLLIEDNPIGHRATADFFEALHCHVDMADRGKAALRLAKKNRYDLILIDIDRLTPIVSYAITFEIKQELLNKRIPVVAITGHQNQRAELFNYGIVDVLSKPLTMEDVHQLLIDWMPGYQREGV